MRAWNAKTKLFVRMAFFPSRYRGLVMSRLRCAICFVASICARSAIKSVIRCTLLTIIHLKLFHHAIELRTNKISTRSNRKLWGHCWDGGCQWGKMQFSNNPIPFCFRSIYPNLLYRFAPLSQ